MTVSNKPGHRGEREVSRKTIARGMPGDFRCDRGDYARVLFLFAREAAGASCARHSLRPLFSGWANIRKTSGASRRENADAYPLGSLKIESETAPERALRRPARPAITGRARYPSINSRASYRADSSAGTAGRCDAADAPSAQTGIALETSAPAAASGFPCADCTANTRRPHFPR